eukprot:718353-Heterocapsa_arctica.AAC.1
MKIDDVEIAAMRASRRTSRTQKLEARHRNRKRRGAMSVVEIMNRNTALSWSTATRRTSQLSM